MSIAHGGDEHAQTCCEGIGFTKTLSGCGLTGEPCVDRPRQRIPGHLVRQWRSVEGWQKVFGPTVPQQLLPHAAVDPVPLVGPSSGSSGKRATNCSPMRKMAFTVPGLGTAWMCSCCHCGNCSATSVRTARGETDNWPGCISTPAASHPRLSSTTDFRSRNVTNVARRECADFWCHMALRPDAWAYRVSSLTARSFASSRRALDRRLSEADPSFWLEILTTFAYELGLTATELDHAIWSYQRAW